MSSAWTSAQSWRRGLGTTPSSSAAKCRGTRIASPIPTGFAIEVVPGDEEWTVYLGEAGFHEHFEPATKPWTSLRGATQASPVCEKSGEAERRSAPCLKRKKVWDGRGSLRHGSSSCPSGARGEKSSCKIRTWSKIAARSKSAPSVLSRPVARRSLRSAYVTLDVSHRVQRVREVRDQVVRILDAD